MRGPLGTIGSAGAGPRPGGTAITYSAPPSGDQLNGLPNPMFTAASVPSRRADDDSTSKIQNWTAVSVSCVKATWLPSGDQRVLRMRASAGRPVTARSAPSSVRSANPFDGRARLGPLVRGLILRPAILSSGADTSAIDGRLGR